jgi:hypothetical protein
VNGYLVHGNWREEPAPRLRPIRGWLEASVGRIVPGRAMKMFEGLVEESPEQAARTTYWTHIIPRQCGSTLRPRLEDLKMQLTPLRGR